MMGNRITLEDTEHMRHTESSSLRVMVPDASPVYGLSSFEELSTYALYYKLGCHGYRVFRIHDGNGIENPDIIPIGFYMADTESRLRAIRRHSDFYMNSSKHLISFLYGYIDLETRTFTLNYIETKQKHLGKKHGMTLLGIALEYIATTYPSVAWVELDDMCDYSGNTCVSRNLYYRLGFFIKVHSRGSWVPWRDTPDAQPIGPERRGHILDIFEAIRRILE